MTASVSVATLSAEVIAAALGQFPPTREQTAVIEAPLAPALVVAGAGQRQDRDDGGARRVARREPASCAATRCSASPSRARPRASSPSASSAGCSGSPSSSGAGSCRAARAARRRDDSTVFGALEREGGDGAKASAARAAAMDLLAAEVGATAAGTPTTTRCCTGRPSRPTTASPTRSCASTRCASDATPRPSILSESAAWLLMRRVVFASDDPRLETRGEAVAQHRRRGAADRARRRRQPRRSLDELAAFPARFRDVLERPSTRKRHGRLQRRRRRGGEGRRARAARRPRARVRGRRSSGSACSTSPTRSPARSRSCARTPSSPTTLRDRYRVVLLDEYQDTSVVQTDLLADALRATPRSWPSATRIRRSTAGAGHPPATSAASRAAFSPRRARARSTRCSRAGATAPTC